MANHTHARTHMRTHTYAHAHAHTRTHAHLLVVDFEVRCPEFVRDALVTRDFVPQMSDAALNEAARVRCRTNGTERRKDKREGSGRRG